MRGKEKGESGRWRGEGGRKTREGGKGRGTRRAGVKGVRES